MPGTIRGACKLGSGTRTSSTRCATPSWHRIGSRTSGVDAAGNAGMHDPPGGRGMRTWAPRGSSQQAQYLRYVGFCWPVPCPELNCATERMYVSWVFADKLRMVMSSIMRWRSGEIGFVIGELLSLDCTKRAILADRRLPTDALTSIESTDRP